MKYKITHAYCWYDNKSMIVKMYFINQIPFTFDELPDYCLEDVDMIEKANETRCFTPEELYNYCFYLIDEECHPLLFDLDLENPEDLPPE